MYGVKQLKFDYTYPDPACDACSNKLLSLFSLGEYCKVYDNKTCCFSELAKDQIHLCKECVFALRKTKVFQTRCFNAQRVMEAHYNLMYPHYQHRPHYQQNNYQMNSTPLPEESVRDYSDYQMNSTPLPEDSVRDYSGYQMNSTPSPEESVRDYSASNNARPTTNVTYTCSCLRRT